MKIEIESLTKILSHNEILNDINLTLESGKIYGFVGKNGSGKTMLMRAICGLIVPTSGCVKIDGKVLYVANYGFNFEGGISNEVNEEAVLIAEPMIPLCVHNEIKVTQVYHFEERDIPV